MKNILVVDDDAGARRSVMRILRGMGFGVFEAQSGSEALAQLAERSFAMVITDKAMPSVDGLLLTRAIRQADPRTQVVVMSGVGTVSDMLTARALGAADYLPKPFEPSVLEGIVTKLMGRA